MLDFNTLLRTMTIDPAEVLLIRHQPREKALRRIFPWLAGERPDLFLAWQRIQWEPLQTAMTKAKFVAAFVGQEPGRATFVELNRITGWRTVDEAGYAAFPGYAELTELGMAGREPGASDCTAFDLERVDAFSDFRGRLIVDWPKPDQSWWRWAKNGAFAIRHILEESRLERGMPSWEDLVLTWDELRVLPMSWRSALANWRGVYFIFDVARNAGYVGSASGAENILGRWMDYAASGHGGNKMLRDGQPKDLRFSILQRTSPDTDAADVTRLESTWKSRLHTRSHGLNLN